MPPRGPDARRGDAALDSTGPTSNAEVDWIHMDPTEPMPAVTRGTLLTGLPDDLLDALLAVAGPGVDVPSALSMLLMGGALAGEATIPNAVAGRDGAFALTVWWLRRRRRWRPSPPS